MGGGPRIVGPRCIFVIHRPIKRTWWFFVTHYTSLTGGSNRPFRCLDLVAFWQYLVVFWLYFGNNRRRGLSAALTLPLPCFPPPWPTDRVKACTEIGTPTCQKFNFANIMILHGYVKVATWICQSCSMYFPSFRKQNYGQLTEWTLRASSELQLVKISTLPTGEHHVLLI